MTLHEFRKLTRHFPRQATLRLNSQSSFELELKFDSEQGWIVDIITKEPPKSS